MPWRCTARTSALPSSTYQIQVIPTVVFFDPASKEIFRHQGFISEEKIKEQFAKMGVV
jgi:thioredoxin 1